VTEQCPLSVSGRLHHAAEAAQTNEHLSQNTSTWLWDRVEMLPVLWQRSCVYMYVCSID